MPSLKLELPAAIRGRLQAIDELKGLAIALIVLYHAGGVLVWRNFLHGDIGVDIFVLLSGVGLTLGSTWEGTGKFLQRRLLRILPAYWLVLTACLLLDAYLLQQTYTMGNIVTHYLGVHVWFGDRYAMGINHAFWYLSLIVAAYPLYAVLRPLLPRPDRFLLAAAVISTGVALAFFWTGQAASFGHLGLRLIGFFVGVLLGLLLKHGRLDLPLTPALGAAALVAVYVPYTQGVVFHTVAAGLALMAGYVFLWKAVAPAALEVGTAKVLRFLGTHSLEIFLIHQPLMRQYHLHFQARWFNDPAPGPWALTVGMAIGLTVTLILSIELHRLLGRLSPPRPASPPP